ncbi:MAG: DUF917 family protein, partial [Xanthobacteraceae bacterium]|nr:DUF917 family protein [Xanthobacteraceae bacterium]
MRRKFVNDDLEAALIGGLFLSAGGSGQGTADRHRVQGRMALDLGGVDFVSLDELPPESTVITATAVGAPGFAKPLVAPRDCLDSARRLIALLDGPP